MEATVEVMEGSNGGNSSSEPSTSTTTSSGFSEKYIPLPAEIMRFAQRMEMHVCQINAQRRFGPSIYIQPGWIPEPGTEVFIGRLPRWMDERDLLPFLEQVGPVYQLRLLMNFSGTNKGYCFAKYFSRAQADLAVEVLHGTEIRQKMKVVASLSVDNRKLILGGIPTNRTVEEIQAQVETISNGILGVYPTWSGNAYQPKGLVFVVFDCHRTAAMARKQLMNKLKPVRFWDHPITVDWAEPEFPTGGKAPEQVLRVSNLTRKTSSRALRLMFHQESFGGVRKIKRFEDTAYVYFWTRGQAEAAKMSMNGLELAGSKLLVKWMNPNFVPLTVREKEKIERRRQQKKIRPQATILLDCCDVN